MIEGLDDYELDKKLGDVGAKVREASIKSITNLLIELYLTQNENFITIFNKYVVLY